MNTRQYSIFDYAVMNINNAVQAAFGITTQVSRVSPAADVAEAELTPSEQRHAANLMRINHVGEVCAQALYQGQALTAKSGEVQKKLSQAAEEENDHLAWCQQRITELNGRVSYLNPLWYVGSLALGAAAGFAGDKINLGFLAETERQVEQHLSEHLEKIPATDHKTRAILSQMRADEAQHATMAQQAGGAALPAPIKFTMRCLSKIMTTVTYWI